MAPGATESPSQRNFRFLESVLRDRTATFAKASSSDDNTALATAFGDMMKVCISCHFAVLAQERRRRRPARETPAPMRLMPTLPLLALAFSLSRTAAAAHEATLYERVCATCHGKDGRNGKAIPIAGLPAEVIVTNIKDHPLSMNSFNLTTRQINAIAKYVAALKH
jgi:hypothetical protein